jgi:DNA-binding transcriptional MerR regulator
MRQGLYIGQVAKETGLRIDTIRFYEREGLLTHPIRSDGGFRVFDPNILRDLEFIRRAQGLGFSLREIRELLVLRRSQSLGCSHVQRLLDQHLAGVENKIKELLSLQTELKTALRKCRRESKHSVGREKLPCPVMEELQRGNGHQEA